MLNGGGLAETAGLGCPSPGSWGSVLLIWRKQSEISSAPHERGIARPVAPFQGHGVPILADHDAFPPAADVIDVLRPFRRMMSWFVAVEHDLYVRFRLPGGADHPLEPHQHVWPVGAVALELARRCSAPRLASTFSGFEFEQLAEEY